MNEAYWYYVSKELQHCMIVPYKLQLLLPWFCCALFLMWRDVLQVEKEEIAKTFSGTSLLTSEIESYSTSANTSVLIKAKFFLLSWRRESLEMFCGIREFCLSRNRRNAFFFSAIQHVTRQPCPDALEKIQLWMGLNNYLDISFRRRFQIASQTARK